MVMGISGSQEILDHKNINWGKSGSFKKCAGHYNFMNLVNEFPNKEVLWIYTFGDLLVLTAEIKVSKLINYINIPILVGGVWLDALVEVENKNETISYEKPKRALKPLTKETTWL